MENNQTVNQPQTQVNKNDFITLNNINVNPYVKEKIGLSYLPWADAWSILKARDPSFNYKIFTCDVPTIIEETIQDEGVTKTVKREYMDTRLYFTDGLTCYVKVAVTLNGEEQIEYLPVMNNKNQAIRASTVTYVDVNKAIQRAFVKACARFGLGLYLYRGEDLPEGDKNQLETLRQEARDLAAPLLKNGDAAAKTSISALITQNCGGSISQCSSVEGLQTLINALKNFAKPQ